MTFTPHSADSLFSVIVPTYNRPDRLQQCLHALSNLRPSTSYEVIVVDDGSDTRLDQIVDPFADVMNVRLLRQGNAGPAAARNRGAESAQGIYLAFTDDDCQPAVDWLERFAERFEADDRQLLLGGKTINALPHNCYSAASQQIVDYLYQMGAPFFTTNNIAIRRDDFMELDGFNEAFPLAAGEDREFCARVLDAGYVLEHVGEARVYHHHEMTMRSFWQQNLNYGRGAYQLRRQLQQQLPVASGQPLSFYVGLLFYPLQRNTTHHSRLNQFTLFVISQVAITMGLLFERQTVHSRNTLRT